MPKLMGVSTIVNDCFCPSRAKHRAELSSASSNQASPVSVEKKIKAPSVTNRASRALARRMMWLISLEMLICSRLRTCAGVWDAPGTLGVFRFAILLFLFHVIEIFVHDLEADRFIEISRRRIRYAGGDARALHSARLHPAQAFEQHGARQSLPAVSWTRA